MNLNHMATQVMEMQIIVLADLAAIWEVVDLPIEFTIIGDPTLFTLTDPLMIL